jgi:hypothetical protein
VERVGWARLGLWVFTAGIFAWIFPNLALGEGVNVGTDVVITIFGVLAALGLPRAVDGLGVGLLRVGLVGVALCQFAQNAISAVTDLTGTNATPVVVVMLASVAVVVGIFRWRQDSWDGDALPWLAAGFAGFAFEPLYYLVLTLAGGGGFSGYLPGTVLVAAGAGVTAWAFWAARDEASTA